MDHETSRIRSKRPFSQVDDADECVPISKRINNLNIKLYRGSRTSQEEPSTSLQPNMEGAFGMDNGPPHYHQHHHQLPGMSGSTPLTYHQPLYPDPAAMYQHMNPHAPGLQYQAGPGPRPPLELGAQAVPYFHQPLPLTPPLENPPVVFHHGIEEDEQMGEEEEETEYDPELGETENPHYYHINRLLFEAHCDRRTRREGYPLDSGPPSFLPC